MAIPAAYDPRHALNAVCPYFTMFPLEFPLRSLERVRDSNMVADPFCGRGTTLYAARFLGIETFGIDCSPVAVAISKAKLSKATKTDVIELAESYLNCGDDVETPTGTFWKRAYHPTVLQDVCRIRHGLLIEGETPEAALLRATVMGVLHGPVTKVGSYLSNQMQRTFAAKPDYAVQFWAKRKLRPPKVGVLASIKRKLDLIFKSPAIESDITSLDNVVCGDSGEAASWTGCHLKIDTVITSPPYYGMRTYVEDQWLRNWFVGGPDHVVYGDDTRLPSSSPEAFAQGLANVWDNIAANADDRLDMFIRFGVLPSRNIDAKSLLMRSFELSDYNWKRVYTKSASSAANGRRQVRQMRSYENAETEFDAHLCLV